MRTANAQISVSMRTLWYEALDSSVKSNNGYNLKFVFVKQLPTFYFDLQNAKIDKGHNSKKSDFFFFF